MVEIEEQHEHSRAAVATFLRDMADQLEEGGEVSLALDGQGVTLDPDEPIELELEGESERVTGDEEAKQSVELELVWRKSIDTRRDAALDTVLTKL